MNVWFLADGKPVPVPRGGATLQRRLSSTCWPADGGREEPGHAPAVPPADAAALRCRDQRVVTVDLGEHASPPAVIRALLQDRVGQLVRTLRGISGVRGVRVLVAGGVPVGLFPGYDLRRPLTVGRRPGPARGGDDPRRPAGASSTSASWRRAG